MLEEARKSHKKGNTTYICCPIEDIDFEEASFDIILSSLAFHYIENYEEIVDKIHKLLKPGGYLVFLQNIRYSLRKGARTGIMMKTERFFTSR